MTLKNDSDFVDGFNDIFREIKTDLSIAILYYNDKEDKELAKAIQETNKSFQGPYDEWQFNGREAEIIIYVTSDVLDIQSMARARRLLIIVTHCNNWGDESNRRHVLAMNHAVKENLVKKLSNDSNISSRRQNRCSIL